MRFGTHSEIMEAFKDENKEKRSDLMLGPFWNSITLRQVNNEENKNISGCHLMKREQEKYNPRSKP